MSFLSSYKFKNLVSPMFGIRIVLYVDNVYFLTPSRKHSVTEALVGGGFQRPCGPPPTQHGTIASTRSGRAWLCLAKPQNPQGQSFLSLPDDLPQGCASIVEIFFLPSSPNPPRCALWPLSPLTLPVAAAQSLLCHLPTSPVYI